MVVEQASGPAAKMACTLSQDGAFSPAAWLERQQLYLQKTAQQLDQEEFGRAVEALAPFGSEAESLRGLAQSLAGREK